MTMEDTKDITGTANPPSAPPSCSAIARDMLQTDWLAMHRENQRLREQLAAMVRRAEYVCAHRYGSGSPAGTRLIAVGDLRDEMLRAKELLTVSPNKGLDRPVYLPVLG